MAIKDIFGGKNTDGPYQGASSVASDPVVAAEGVSANGGILMTLGRTLFFKGELGADVDFVLLGRLEGTITRAKGVTIGAGGVVIGDVCGRQITIKGRVEGDVDASEAIVVESGAQVTGDLCAPRVTILDGAKFNGAVDMSDTAPKGRE